MVLSCKWTPRTRWVRRRGASRPALETRRLVSSSIPPRDSITFGGDHFAADRASEACAQDRRSSIARSTERARAGPSHFVRLGARRSLIQDWRGQDRAPRRGAGEARD
jgi:hypothetical protein